MGVGPSKEELLTAELNIPNGRAKKPIQEGGYVANNAIDEPRKMTSVDEPKNAATKSMVEQLNGSRKPTEENEKVAKRNEAGIPSLSLSNNKKKRFWVDEKTGHNCFTLFARDLSITWSEDIRYWHWVPTYDEEIELASLLNVCWLEVHGKFDTSRLTPGITYEVAFAVMIKDPSYGWNAPVNLRLKFGDGRVQEEGKVCLQEKPRGQWIELKAGEIDAMQPGPGEVEISLFEYESGQWKRGLIIRSIIIRPKN